jgi:hypothetical protein
MHNFIEEYFKNSIESIKLFHNKLNKMFINEQTEDYSIYTIYQKKKNFYAIKNNDPKTAKHLKYFTLEQINQMHIPSLFLNKSMFYKYVNTL